MTKAEKQHMNRVAELGCIICKSPAELHHPRRVSGMAMRASHFDVIPLCPIHHRIGGFGVAIHAGQKTFEANFGTEQELLAQTKRLLNAD